VSSRAIPTPSGWYEGRCKDCAEPAIKNAARCEACRKEHNKVEARRRRERKEAGLCTVCGGKAIVVDGEPLTTCKTHREYYAERARAARAARVRAPPLRARDEASPPAEGARALSR
jgi:hypothetical protein